MHLGCVLQVARFPALGPENRAPYSCVELHHCGAMAASALITSLITSIRSLGLLSPYPLLAAISLTPKRCRELEFLEARLCRPL